MFFKQGQKPKDQPKKRSVLGLLFNPRVDREIEPLKQSMGMFVRMLALIFASYRLFPKNHPAFNDSTVRLTLGTVIGTAFKQLAFTKKGVPQVIVFFAIVGCLLFALLSVVTLLLSLVVAPAHAQGIFTSPAANDWGIQWIDYLFMAKPMTASYSSVAPPTETAMQQALGSALSFYSTAILALAGLLLIYHLTFMIAETAHTGKPMGRANQIWAPIRLVFAIGMLVPIGASSGSSTTVTGYNTAQYLAMQVGRWGSGLASQVWSNFTAKLNTATSFGDCTTGIKSDGTLDTSVSQPPSCVYISAQAANLVKGLIAIDACAYITNFYIDQAKVNEGASWDIDSGEFSGVAMMASASVVDSYGAVMTLNEIPDKLKVGSHYASFETTTQNNFDADDLEGFCGGYEITDFPTGPFKNVRDVQLKQFEQLMTDVHAYVKDNARDMIPSSGGLSEKAKETRSKQLKSITDSFTKQLNTDVRAALANAGTAASTLLKTDLGGTRYTSTGWLTAGSWFNEITKLMAMRSSAVRNSLPTLIAPSISSSSMAGADGGKLKGAVADAAAAYTNFMNAVNDEVKYNAKKVSLDKTPLGQGLEDNDGMVMGFIKAYNPVTLFLLSIDSLGSFLGMWNDGGLAINFGVSNNPLAEVAAFGQNSVEYGNILMSVGAVTYGLGAGVGTSAGAKITGKLGLVGKLAQVAGGAMSFIGSMFITIAALFYMIGFTLGFIVPLFPFYRFFFGSLQWVMSIFEAVVLAPLFALAHINPYGEGLAGQQAKYGYSVAMQVLLRPALMVFGLIAGYLLFSVALHFLNDAFLVVTKGTGAYSGGTVVIAKIVYSVLYCVLVVILANQCFSTIGLFPQVALSYLGMGQVKEESIGDTGMLTTAAGYVAKDVLMSKLPGAVKNPIDSISAHDKNKLAIDEKENAGIAAAKQQSTLEDIEKNTR